MQAAITNWFAQPRWITDEGETSKDDLAVIVVPEAFGILDHWPTDYHDYLRIYSDDPDNLNNGKQKVYGAGLTSPDGNGAPDDQLRYGAFDAVIKEGEYLKMKGYQDPDIRMCMGDNGGPFEYNVMVGGQSVAMMAAVWSNFTQGTNGHCASNNQSHDDSYASLLTNNRIQWVESVTGLSCAPQSGGSYDYRRCFELPFIEDVPGEGLYEPNVATAIVMAALW